MSSETDKLEERRARNDAGSLAEDSAAAKAPAAQTKSKSSKSVPPPRSRRVPLNAGPKSSRRIPLNAGPKSSRMKAAPPPRSRRMAALHEGGNEPSIPPVASDLDDRGQRIFKVGPTPSVAPAPLPARPATRVVSRAEEEADRVAASLARPGISPYVRAVAGLALAVAIVLAGRGFVQRARSHQAPLVAAAAAPPPAVDPIPPPPAVEEPAPASPDPAPSGSAEAEKASSLAFLQQGKLDDAVAAGERATALDPTDADAWRILGAAYQDQGNFVAARRSFGACTKSATHGDIRECTLLLK